MTQSCAGDYELRVCEPNAMTVLRTERVHVDVEPPTDLDLTLENTCVVTIRLADQPALSPGEMCGLAVVRESGAMAFGFRLDGDGAQYTIRSEPFRIAWTRLTRVLTERYTPGPGDCFDVVLRGPLDGVETSIIVTHTASDEKLRAFGPSPPDRLSPMKSRNEGQRTEGGVTLSVGRPKSAVVSASVVGLNSGRVGLVSIDPHAREVTCRLEAGGGVSFRWSDGKARVMDMVLTPMSGTREASGITNCPNLPDEQWSPMLDGRMGGLGTALEVYGLSPGTYRARIKHKDVTVLDRDVTVMDGSIVETALEPPK